MRKAINNKIEQNKAQYNLDRQTAKISALSTGNVSKYEFLTGKDVLSEKDLPEIAAALKKFEYSPLGKELKAQTSAAEKQSQKIDKVFESTKKEEIKSHDKLLNIYTTKYDNLPEDQKKKVNVLNRPENLTLDFV